VVKCSKGESYQTCTTNHLNMLHNFRTIFRDLASSVCAVSPLIFAQQFFRVLICCHGTVRPALVDGKGASQDNLKGLSKDRF